MPFEEVNYLIARVISSAFISIVYADPPRGDESWIPTDPRFQHGVDLVSYIREHSDYSDFSIGVAGRFVLAIHMIYVSLTFSGE